MPIYFFWVYHKSSIPTYIRNTHSLRMTIRREVYAICITIMNKLCHILHSVLIYHLKRNYMPWHVYRYTWVWRVK
ncbi:protein E16C [Elephant endotheliotropic herpesvirus 6]|nr:protein E16C [Elephant endotheliotropic herpesvirus 6]